MNFMTYLNLVKQFFFKKAHTFTVRIGADKVVIAISVEAPDATHVPFAISFSDALNLVSLIENHAQVAVSSPLSFDAYVDGNIQVTITVSKV